jgi:quercetin dioxygenase-like cupin family protein
VLVYAVTVLRLATRLIHSGDVFQQLHLKELMPIYQLENIPEEFVTPQHSTAYGRLITGTQVEVGLLRYKTGEGAKQHAHPHEQILLVLSGKCRLTLDGKATIIGSGMAALIPPNTPHALEVLEDTEVVSCKSVIGGVGHRISGS